MRAFFDINAFVPAAFDAYRALIVESFELFVDRLSPPRQAAMLTAQHPLPGDATAEQRLVACLRCCPTLHKLGQILARDKRLSPALRGELQVLERLGATASLDDVRPTIERELGAAIQDYDIQFEAHALAEGSVAVAWPIAWAPPASAVGRRRGVLKIPHPGIRERVAEELDILDAIAARVEEEGERYGVPALACREAFDDVRELLTNEIDFRGEQSHLDRAARQYADDPSVAIPLLAPFCTDEITAMSRLDGGKVTETVDAPPSERRQMAERIASALLSRVIFSKDADVLFHGDPHAGNLLHMADGRLGVIDWSLSATLSDAQRRALTQMVIAGFTFDSTLLRHQLGSLAVRRPADDAVRRVGDEAMAALNPVSPPGLSWLTRLLDRASLAGVQFPKNAMLFRKALHTLEGVVADVSPGVSLDSMLWSKGLAAFATDLPTRGIAGPTDDRFAVRLSNADLVHAWCSLPFAPLRYWQQALDRMVRRGDR